jgi:hypothetical protein
VALPDKPKACPATHDQLRARPQACSYRLRLRPGHHVFALGCASGTDLASNATAVGPTGTAVGLDHDQTAIRDAQQATAHLPQVEVITGEAHQSGSLLRRGRVDAAAPGRCARHRRNRSKNRDSPDCSDPVAWPCSPNPIGPPWSLTTPDRILVRAHTRYVVEHQVRNSRIGSQLPRLAHRTGLHAKRVIPNTGTYTDVHAADQVLGFERSPSEQSSTA